MKSLDKVATMMGEGEFKGLESSKSRAAVGAMTKEEAQRKAASPESL